MTRHLAIASLIVALAAGTASADTLREALKATDATVAIARAAGRPQISGVVGVNRNLTRSGVIAQTQGNDHNISLSGGVDLSLPIFNGGRVRNSVEAAKTRVEAGRATLRAVEGDVFTDAVAAYMDVIRDRAIVELNQNNVKVLQTNLEATRDRFEIGDVTRTDVAQSEARLELGKANLASAESRLQTSIENYKRVIGQSPGDLAPPWRRGFARPRRSRARRASWSSARSGWWSPTPAPPSQATRPRSTRSNQASSRSTPTSSLSKAPGPSRASVPATSSTSSTPSRNCSTRR